MVDFKRRLQSEPLAKELDPVKLFHGSVRKEKLSYLRDVQSDVLAQWFDRRAEPELVIKMNTGAGKTLVALLCLQSSLNEGLGPALYVTPTNQLVEQVVAQAAEAGINTCVFSSDNNELPIPFVNSSAILVTTFQKLFNGRSVFGTSGSSRRIVEAGTIAFDDAHACVTIARDQATIKIPKSAPLYRSLFDVLADALSTQSPTWASALNAGDPGAFMVVPSWSWRNKLPVIIETLTPERDSNPLRFSWNLIQDHLIYCSCAITSQAIEIAPLVVPIDSVPTIIRAKRRILFSATLFDDSSLIRDFKISVASTIRPIIPKLAGDVGERMILSPLLISQGDMELERLKPLLRNLAQSSNVVVLSPSLRSANERWGDLATSISNEDNIQTLLNDLKARQGQITVIVNRYDGIDLAGDLCRILVIDGLPGHSSLYERHESDVAGHAESWTRRVAQKLEQGMGRGVRSGTDHCVVLLVSHDVVAFLAERSTRRVLSPETSVQLQLGDELSLEIGSATGRNILRDLNETILQSLKQDPDWKAYHKQRLAGAQEVTPTSEQRCRLAEADRRAIELAGAGREPEGVAELQRALSDATIEDPGEHAWYLQRIAHIEAAFDSAKAQQTQSAAFLESPRVSRPISGAVYTRLPQDLLQQGQRLRAWLQRQVDARAVPVAVDALLAYLTFTSPASVFESSLARLAEILGFVGQRPDHDAAVGPDVLWYANGDTYFVIECKNEVKTTRSISKSEASQLLSSVAWFEEQYPGQTGHAILVHPSDVLAADAFQNVACRVITPRVLDELKASVRELATALASRPIDGWAPDSLSTELSARHLSAKAIFARCQQTSTKRA